MSALLPYQFVKTEQYTALVCLDSITAEQTAKQICQAIYEFIETHELKSIGTKKLLSFTSFITLFPHEKILSKEDAARKLFTLLRNIHFYDKTKFEWDSSVSNDPKNDFFSFSVGNEAFFIPFMYPGSYAPARRTKIPMLVFNSHRLFQELKKRGKFETAKQVIRQKQLERFGFIPELLADYAEDLEFLQYLLPAPDEISMAWTILNEIAGDQPFE